jgi:DNA-3-methyladenine glycosylase I
MSVDFNRCSWCGLDPLYIKYHDNEWGVPLHDDRLLFELLILEGFQAGLSWLTVLKKRESFQKAFNGFDAHEIVQFGQSKIESLIQNSAIIRNRAKILATMQNARSFLEIKERFGSFDHYIWQFVEGRTRVNHWKSEGLVPAKTVESEKMSRDMRSRGFKFVGPTICYAFMQAAGLVNDHITICFRHSELQAIT